MTGLIIALIIAFLGVVISIYIAGRDENTGKFF